MLAGSNMWAERGKDKEGAFWGQPDDQSGRASRLMKQGRVKEGRGGGEKEQSLTECQRNSGSLPKNEGGKKSVLFN